VADVAARLGIGEQVRLVAALRWQILRNQLRKKSSKLDLIGLAFAAFFAGATVLAISTAFYWGGYVSASSGHFVWISLLFWAVFFFWQVFPIFVAGFGATFEFRNLLRFPMSLGAFYVIGLAYGLADFSALACVCWLLAMILGVASGAASLLPAMIVITALVIVLNATLERLFGSWLERLLARRVTREILFALFIIASVALQFIRPLVERFEHGAPIPFRQFSPYLAVLPPSLAGRALAAAASHQISLLLASLAGIVAYIFVFSVLLWKRFAAQHRGEELSETAAPARIAVRHVPAREDAADPLRWLSPQVAAVFRKDLRYLTRNMFVLVSLAVPPFMVLLFSSQFAGVHPTITRHAVSPNMFFPAMIGYLMLILMMPAYNCFAYEGRGIQSYFTAPVRFREVFLGKNLVYAFVLLFELILSIALLRWRIGLPSLPVFVATLAGFLFAVSGQFSIANWASISFPRKLEFGSMRSQRNSGVSIWLGFGVQLLLGGICSLILFVGRWTGNPWLPAEALAALTVVSLGGYVSSLDALTNLAEKKKEVLIEALCR
jgi:ABC-2 type transport system permease protein